jgi:hypothetical protein
MATFVVVRKEGLYHPSCKLLFRRQKRLQQRLRTHPVGPLRLRQHSPIFLEFESRTREIVQGRRQAAEGGMVGMGICVRGGLCGAQLRDRRLDRFVRVFVPFVREDLCGGGRVPLGGPSYPRGGCGRAGRDEVRGCNDEAGGMRREGRGGGSLAEGLVVAVWLCVAGGGLARGVWLRRGRLRARTVGGCSRSTAS